MSYQPFVSYRRKYRDSSIGDNGRTKSESLLDHSHFTLISNLPKKGAEHKLSSYLNREGVYPVYTKFWRVPFSEGELIGNGLLIFPSRIECELGQEVLNRTLFEGNKLRAEYYNPIYTKVNGGKFNLFVSGLPPQTGLPQLYNMFKEFGGILSLRMSSPTQRIYNNNHSNSRKLEGYAFVQYVTPQAAFMAKSMLQDGGDEIRIESYKGRGTRTLDNYVKGGFNNLLVHNLPSNDDFTSESLKEMFEPFGEIVSCVLQRRVVEEKERIRALMLSGGGATGEGEEGTQGGNSRQSTRQSIRHLFRGVSGVVNSVETTVPTQISPAPTGIPTQISSSTTDTDNKSENPQCADPPTNREEVVQGYVCFKDGSAAEGALVLNGEYIRRRKRERGKNQIYQMVVKRHTKKGELHRIRAAIRDVERERANQLFFNCSLIVKPLPESVGDVELHSYFSQFGQIRFARVISYGGNSMGKGKGNNSDYAYNNGNTQPNNNNNSARTCRIGFIGYYKQEEAGVAKVCTDGHTLYGQSVYSNYLHPKSARVPLLSFVQQRAHISHKVYNYVQHLECMPHYTGKGEMEEEISHKLPILLPLWEECVWRTPAHLAPPLLRGGEGYLNAYLREVLRIGNELLRVDYLPRQGETMRSRRGGRGERGERGTGGTGTYHGTQIPKLVALGGEGSIVAKVLASLIGMVFPYGDEMSLKIYAQWGYHQVIFLATQHELDYAIINWYLKHI